MVALLSRCCQYDRPMAASASENTTFVLVHSPFVGPTTWQFVANWLEGRGFSTLIPDLRKVWLERPPHHLRLAKSVAEGVRQASLAGRTILVAHSGAGPLLPAIDAILGQRGTAFLFVDAPLPSPGHSWFEGAPPELSADLRKLVRGGRLPSWDKWFPTDVILSLLPDEKLRRRFVAELPRVPLSYFEEAAPFLELPPDAECAYLQLSPAYSAAAAEAEARGWPIERISSNHLAPLTEPARVGELIIDLTRDVP